MSRPTARVRWLPGAELPPRDARPHLASGAGEGTGFQLDWLEDYHRTPAGEPSLPPRDQVSD